MNDENHDVPVANDRYNLRPRRRNPENEVADRNRDNFLGRPQRRRRQNDRLIRPRQLRRVDPNPELGFPVLNRPFEAFGEHFPFHFEEPVRIPGLEGLVDVSDVDESEESDDEDSDDSSSTTSGNEPPIPLFRMDEGMVHGILSDEEDEEDAQDNDWHPFEPFGLNLEQAGELNNVIDVFRRIAYGLNSTRTSIQFDTLPPPRPLDPQKIDLYRGNLPPVGSIPMHRNFLIPPFTNAIVDAMPTQIQRKHIFLTNFTRDCWNGLQDTSKQSELRILKSKIWCTEETAQMLKKYYYLLYIEIQDLLHLLIPNRFYQILVEDPADRLSVMALPLDTIPGSCMYFMSKEKKFLLHTGSNAGQENFAPTFKKIKELAPSIDIMYIDSALYFPGSADSFRQKLEGRVEAMYRLKMFLTAMASNEDNNYFFSIHYQTGMEKFLVELVSWVTDWKIGITDDLYEWNYKELLDYRDKLVKIDHLDCRHLSNTTQDNTRIFFYTDECSDFDHVHSTNSDHVKIHVIYDYHSGLERVREPRGCNSVMYQKCRAFNNDPDSEEQDLNYYVLYPSHPTTFQIRTIIKQLKPDKIFGLSRAPGVNYTELKEDFKRLTDAFVRTSELVE